MGFVSAIIKGATKEAAKSAKKATKKATKAVTKEKGLATRQEDYSFSAPLPKKESDVNFTEAFKDTTIIDKEGKPEVVYHGRVQDYDSFNTSGEMSTGKELGTHFGTKEQTDVFASKEGGNVVPVYLNLKNPYHMIDSGSFNGEDIIEQLVEDGLVDSSYIDDLDLPMQELNILAKKLLKEKGFDGISYINTREGLSIKGKPITSQKKIDELQDYDLKTLIEKYGAKKSYIILEPEQAKSVFNKGSWDSKDKRFNYAKGGNVEQMKKLFADGGMMDNSGEQVNGVEVPPGSLRGEVADDIPAQLSEGEFVVPADVVRFVGLEKLMAMRDKAKQGLERMEEMGQMGNAQEVNNPDQTFGQSDEDFSAEIDNILAEEGDAAMSSMPAGFATGGFVTGQDLSKVPTNPTVDVGYYKHSDGRMMWITKINGKPMSTPPDGFKEVSAEEFQSVGKKAEEASTAKPSAVSTTAGMGNGGEGDYGVGDGSGSGGGASVGPVGLGATGLGLMAIGETLGKTPSVYGQLAGAAARAAGGKTVDVAIDQTTAGFNAMQSANAMPGMQSSVNSQGNVTTFSSPATIAASDAAMFAPTPMESLNEALADSSIGTQAANTGMATNAQGQTVSSNASIAAQDAANFGAISTSQGLGSASEAASTGMTSVGGVSVSNDASIAAQDAANFGVDAATGSGGGGGGGDSGRYCCSRMVHHGLWNEHHEFARLTVWSRKQPNWWRSGYPVWGKIIAKHLLKEKGFWTDVMQAFYDHKVRKQKRTIKSTLADLVIFPGAFVCGLIYKNIPEKATLAHPSEFI